MKKEAKISVIISLCLLCVLVVVILVKLYYRKQTATSREYHEKTPGEIPADETPDAMEARARDNFKKITDKYSTITDPEFFKIEDLVFEYEEYFGENRKDAQEYNDARSLYGEASILKALAKPNLICQRFKVEEFWYVFSIRMFHSEYLLKLECQSKGVDFDKIHSVAAYLRAPFLQNLCLWYNNKPDTSYFETQPAVKLQSCGYIIEKFLSSLFEMASLAAEVCPKQYPPERLQSLQSELDELVQKIFKLS